MTKHTDCTTMPTITSPLELLYHDNGVLIAQTQAGAFDKFAAEDLYGAFNLGLHVGDNPITVLNHRIELMGYLRQYQPAIDRIHWLNQVHGNTVLMVDGSRSQRLYDADALISTRPNTALAIMTADCVPVAIFDEQAGVGNKAIACIHAGWQGLTLGVIAKTFAKIPTPNRPKAIIGACISQAAYQIDAELGDRIVRQVVANELVALDESALAQAILSADTSNKVRLDVAKLARLELEHLGVVVLNNEPICSYHSPVHYSYRAQTHGKKSATGRMALLIAAG
ncbi:conserved hypothetical protein [Moraxella cuniculi DSM 21768]|uniref:Purine nucleoside phosphorylase n=1 Tax=Moraxella cuniculi DSM 21768 TaxID=1122245 RepID=A0A1N7FU01_9GAMM|nr:polyphenol oxidase family protein [Moraxella cuniculi]SIS03754.1 conserved hypothetical protein [Moraxella cuniculi DSM 21768]